MNKFIAFFFALALGSSMHAQFGTAPDFTVTDLYSLAESGPLLRDA